MPAKAAVPAQEADPICKYLKNNKVLLVQRVNLSTTTKEKIVKDVIAKLKTGRKASSTEVVDYL